MADYTEADATALRQAIASGALRVRFVDREVTYRSLAEMRQILDMIERALGKPRLRQIRPVTRKGLSGRGLC